MTRPLHHPLLAPRHGFAAALADAPEALVRPVQVHGARAVRADDAAAGARADAIVATRPGRAVGVVTADCIPVLACAEGGAVAAIHAGWRGLAQGVVESGIAALAHDAPGEALRAVVGPCAGPCCYEVDAPVLDALGAWHPRALEAAVRPSRPGHVWLDLPALARAALLRAGLPGAGIGELADACTVCHDGFESVRRDGAGAGRMLHWIVAGRPES